MPIGSFIAQPVLNSLLAAYRPVVIRVAATRTDGAALPPVVYCDIYFNDTFYKTLSKSQTTKLNVINSEWEFDIQDAAQEYLQKYLALNGDSSLLEATGIMAKAYCRFRSSRFDVEGFILAEGTIPVQSTSGTSAVAGTGTQSNNFYVVNATLQHEHNQNFEEHLFQQKHGVWQTTAFPLTHRPARYYIGRNQSDFFGFINSGSLSLDCLKLNYRYIGQQTFQSREVCNLPCTLIGNIQWSANVVTGSGTGDQVITFTWNELPASATGVKISYRIQDSSDPYTTVNVGTASGQEIEVAYGFYEVKITAVGTNCTDNFTTLEDVGISEAPACPMPINVNFDTITSSSARAYWMEPSPLPDNSYEWRLFQADTPGSPVQTGSTSGTSVNLTGLLAGTDYQFYVRSACADGSYSPYAEGADDPDFTTSASGTFPTANRVGLWKESGMTIDTGLVTDWVEATANGKDWATTTPGTEPTDEGADGMGNDGTRYMEISPDLSIPAPYTAYIRLQIDAYDSELLSSTSAPYGYLLLFDPAGTYTRPDGAAPFATNNTSVPAGSFITLCLKRVLDTHTMFVDGVLHGTWDGAAIGDPFISSILFGEPGFIFKGKLRRLALFSDAHSNSECIANSITFLSA